MPAVQSNVSDLCYVRFLIRAGEYTKISIICFFLNTNYTEKEIFMKINEPVQKPSFHKPHIKFHGRMARVFEVSVFEKYSNFYLQSTLNVFCLLINEAFFLDFQIFMSGHSK